MFRKITGIVGTLAVVGVIVMASLSPRTEGFFPEEFGFLKRKAPVEGTLHDVDADDTKSVDADTIKESAAPSVDSVATPFRDSINTSDTTPLQIEI